MPAPVPCVRANYHAFPTTYPSSFIHSAYPLYYPSFSLRERDRERETETETERVRERNRQTHTEREREGEKRGTWYLTVSWPPRLNQGTKRRGEGEGGRKRDGNRDRVRQRNSGYKISSKYMYTLKIVSSLPDIDETHTLIFFLYPPQYLIFMNCMHWLSFYLCVYVHLHTLKIVFSQPDIHALILSLSLSLSVHILFCAMCWFLNPIPAWVKDPPTRTKQRNHESNKPRRPYSLGISHGLMVYNSQ